MKNILIIILVLSLSACGNGKIKKDIENLVDSEIKDLKVEKVVIEENYTEYTQEAWDYAAKLLQIVQEMAKYMTLTDAARSSYELALKWDRARANDYAREHNFYLAKVDSINNVVQKLKDEVGAYDASHQKGTLYITKFYQKNEFGIFEKQARYRVLTYNDKGEPWFYVGNNAAPLVLSVYPEMQQDLQKRLDDVAIEYIYKNR